MRRDSLLARLLGKAQNPLRNVATYGQPKIMLFPDSPRVIFRNNPLTEVICQLRVPTQLRIDSEPPASFQERIKKDYPILRTGQAIHAQVRADMMVGDPVLFKPAQGRMGVYDFISADKNWKVSLSSGFLALSTVKYERWEGFSKRLDEVIKVHAEIYNPGFCIRLGLRYQNLISREAIGLDGRSWSELIHPAICGPIGSADFGGNAVDSYLGFFKVASTADPAHFVQVQHGAVLNDETKKHQFLIDVDFYAEGTIKYENVENNLRLFHREAGNFFRACVKRDLLNALGPTPAS